ncbi:MAG: hypothetical protein ACE5H7_04095 [Acidiferrobacterales bacterium]
MSRMSRAFLLLLLAPVPTLSLAQACPDGQTLGPGERRDVLIKFGHDHWIKADFPATLAITWRSLM